VFLPFLVVVVRNESIIPTRLESITSCPLYLLARPVAPLYSETMTDEVSQQRQRGLEKRQAELALELDRIFRLITDIENGNARLRRSRLRAVGWD